MYAGPRRGELLALRWEDIDLDRGVIRVERGWDAKEGVLESPKSRAGRRTVPVTPILREHLLTHALATGRRSGLVFGRTATTPFNPSALGQRAKRAWADAGLSPITLHEARHTFASLMIAAGVHAKALSVYMGHSSIVISVDLYGHLLPGDEAESAAMLDALLSRHNQEVSTMLS
jgi:integrase